MNGSDNVGEVALKVINVSNCLIDIFSDFIDNFIQLIIVDGEIVFKDSDCLFAGFSENGGDFINEINFGDEHSGEEWSD
jgi:hypothetical protein